MKIIITLILLISCICESKSQYFEGVIDFSIHREWLNRKDSLEFSTILNHVFMSSKDFTSKRVTIGKDKIVQKLISNDKTLTSVSFTKEMQDFTYSVESNRINPINKMPKISLKFINKTTEAKTIIGYKCRKYVFESTCMGQTDLCYLWITEEFTPSKEQKESLFKEYFLLAGLVLRKEFIQKNYVKTIEEAISIDIKNVESQIINILKLEN